MRLRAYAELSRVNDEYAATTSSLRDTLHSASMIFEGERAAGTVSIGLYFAQDEQKCKTVLMRLKRSQRSPKLRLQYLKGFQTLHRFFLMPCSVASNM